MSASKGPPTRLSRSHLVTVSSAGARLFEPPPPLVADPLLIKPMVFLNQYNGLALAQMKAPRCTPPTPMVSTASGSRIHRTEVQVLVSQTRTAMGTRLHCELIFTSLPATTHPRITPNGKPTWSSQPMETALRVGLIILISSWKPTGTPPSSKMNGHQVKESNHSSFPKAIQPATASMPIL
jgi:hypothetical protein